MLQKGLSCPSMGGDFLLNFRLLPTEQQILRSVAHIQKYYSNNYVNINTRDEDARDFFSAQNNFKSRSHFSYTEQLLPTDLVLSLAFLATENKFRDHPRLLLLVPPAPSLQSAPRSHPIPISWTSPNLFLPPPAA